MTGWALLAKRHFRRALEGADYDRAASAMAVWSSLAAKDLDRRWGGAELAQRRDDEPEALRFLEPLVERGAWVNPLDPVRWAVRLLRASRLDEAAECLGWARRLVPELPEVWRLLGDLEARRGRLREARTCWRRALALDPQDVEAFLGCLDTAEGRPPPALEGTEARPEAPGSLEPGGRAEARLEVDGADASWTLFVLPPSGWGVIPETPSVPFGADGRASVGLTARRPDRVRGGAWPVVFLAVGPQGYVKAETRIRVPDPKPGELLVAVTEDHEIHEERGLLPAPMLRKLLVDKSRFAADSAAAWTHMVETGSALAMPAWAAAEEPQGPWPELETAVREHLLDELERGHDLQPHLHAFNDPAYPHFPYRVTEAGWRPSLRFLLTSPEHRGDWASACPPPGRVDGGIDRLQSVERAVAQLESLARGADPGYRAALWRSGLLEYGDGPEDCAWSAVALRRAGLLAVSDLPSPRRVRARPAPTAFFCGWERPFEEEPGGPLLQLPVAANLEGDFVTGPRRLRRLARRTARSLRRPGAATAPGVHLVTLLTHDKFLNARAGGDEFRLDRGYGDWVTIREHLEAWRKQGARFVTAREGVRAVLADATWRLVPWLAEETFVLSAPEACEIRYRVELLGDGIPISETWPQEVLVPVPPSLRPGLEALRFEQNGRPLSHDREKGSPQAWVRLTSPDPVFVFFHLVDRPGPFLRSVSPAADSGWRLTVEAPETFRRARLLVPWTFLEPPGKGPPEWAGTLPSGEALEPRPEPGGLLLAGVRLGAAGDRGPVTQELLLRPVTAPRPAGREATSPAPAG